MWEVRRPKKTQAVPKSQPVGIAIIYRANNIEEMWESFQCTWERKYDDLRSELYEKITQMANYKNVWAVWMCDIYRLWGVVCATDMLWSMNDWFFRFSRSITAYSTWYAWDLAATISLIMPSNTSLPSSDFSISSHTLSISQGINPCSTSAIHHSMS